jgi:hypothetical protein
MESNDQAKAHFWVGILRELWDTFGLSTILLAVILALWVGWLPSPLSAAKDVLERHVSYDDEIRFYLRSMCQSSAKMVNRPMEDCNWQRHSN